MSNKVIVTKSKLNAIGDALRETTGTEDKYPLNDMPNLIRNISDNRRYIDSGLPIFTNVCNNTLTILTNLR